MGIDFGSTATYKWLMGERGFGFLYVREDLQNTVVPTTRYGHRQIANFDRIGITWEPLPGAARYETGTFPNALAVCACRRPRPGWLYERLVRRIQRHSHPGRGRPRRTRQPPKSGIRGRRGAASSSHGGATQRRPETRRGGPDTRMM